MNATEPAGIQPSRILSATFELYRRHAAVLLGAAVAVFALDALVASVLDEGAAVLLALVLSMLLQALYTGAVVLVVAAEREGAPIPSAGDLLAGTLPFAPPLAVAGLLAALGTLVGFALLIVPGLIALTVWSVASAVVVIERRGPLASLQRSRELVRGDGWPVLGVMLTLVVSAIVAGFVVGMLVIEAGLVATVIVNWGFAVVTAPLLALPAVVLYYALLDRR